MTSTQTNTQNIFARSLAISSDEGQSLTKNEFQHTVESLTKKQGRLTGSIVRKIRQDWEALGDASTHPATADAEAAYRAFVKSFGALELLELLSPRKPQA